jgi:hypothetical protein
MPWTGAGARVLQLFEQARACDLTGAGLWGKLGLALYDDFHYDQALQAFHQAFHQASELDSDPEDENKAPILLIVVLLTKSSMRFFQEIT